VVKFRRKLKETTLAVYECSSIVQEEKALRSLPALKQAHDAASQVLQ
jgi:hypothetical protein